MRLHGDVLDTFSPFHDPYYPCAAGQRGRIRLIHALSELHRFPIAEPFHVYVERDFSLFSPSRVISPPQDTLLCPLVPLKA